MKKLRYGLFVDRKIEAQSSSDWDDMLIGGHAYVRREQEKNWETAGYEYYYKRKGKTYIVKNPTMFEKLLAKLTRITSFNSLGYREHYETETVSDTNELQQRLDEIKKLERELKEKRATEELEKDQEHSV